MCDPDYLVKNYFDLRNVLLPAKKNYYIDHQVFIVSEITKIWDEAEYLYWYCHELDLPNDVWAEIYEISRYGGGELFAEYLMATANSAHIPHYKVRSYSVAEQGMLFKYKWEKDKQENHPYGE